MKLFRLFVVLLFAVLPAFGDSFNVFMVQSTPDGHWVDILMDPNGNPLIHQTYFGGPDPHLVIDVPAFEPVLSQTEISLNIILGGQTILFEVTQDCGTPPIPPCGFMLDEPTPFFPKPVDSELIATINGQTETFHFRYVTTTVPEPTTMMLLGTGLAAIGWRKFRGRPTA